MGFRSVWRRLAVVVVGAVVGLGGTAVAAQAATPVAMTAPIASAAAASCRGAGGVLSNFTGFVTGGLHAAILGEADLGTPYLDGDVVRVEGSVPFYDWGSCGSQVAFQLETKVCGTFGCSWEVRNHGTWEFFWEHDDSGVVAQQVGMTCRAGTNSYRIHMAVENVVSAAEKPEKGKGAIGAELEPEQEDGPVVKLSC
jgi:hypothetical protein